MLRKIFILLLLAGPIVHAADLLPQPVTVETGQLAGAANETGDVMIFKGIPYAAPPVGKLRWFEPQPALKWEGVRPAIAFGNTCTQPVSSGNPPYTREFGDDMPRSEDCLYLNVWTPAKSASDKLAVLIYIHGGAFTVGSGSNGLFNGEELAKKGILTITFNYRLGYFAGMGHPDLSKESPHHVCGNYGMLDILEALKWVHKNIAAFGGDPEKVTLSGQSSGCLALQYLTTSPLAKGFFRSVIAVSFPADRLLKPHAIGDVAQKEQLGLKFAAAKKAASLEDLRKIPGPDLLANDPGVDALTRGALGGGVNTDGWAFPFPYAEALEKGLASDVPTLIGITADDYGKPAAYMTTTVDTFAKTLPTMFGERKAAFELMSDAYLALCPVKTDPEAREVAKRAQVEYRQLSLFDWARKRAKTAKTPAYTYIFQHVMPWPEHPEFGAFHSSDLVYEFNNLKRLNRPWTDTDRHVAEEVSSYWVNFVKTGNPNGENLPKWDAFSPDQPVLMNLGAKSGPAPIAPKERLDFYETLLEKVVPK